MLVFEILKGECEWTLEFLSGPIAASVAQLVERLSCWHLSSVVSSNPTCMDGYRSQYL